MNFRMAAVLLLITFISACSGTRFSTSEAIKQVEATLAQTTAAEMAKQTLTNLGAKVGLTPQQTQQILPILTQYYLSTATALKNNTGTKGVLQGFKDTFISQVSTVLTPAQLTQVKKVL